MKNPKGYSLIELIIVVAILAIVGTAVFGFFLTSSRLYKNLVESQDEPYYYQIESCHYQFKDGDNFFIEANFNADKKDIVENELKEYLKGLEKIDEEELRKAIADYQSRERRFGKTGEQVAKK